MLQLWWIRFQSLRPYWRRLSSTIDEHELACPPAVRRGRRAQLKFEFEFGASIEIANYRTLLDVRLDVLLGRVVDFAAARGNASTKQGVNTPEPGKCT